MFVADELPRELRRLIEFLNEHMPRIEVLGIEVRQYTQGGLRALVPRVIGQTERARESRRGATPVRMTTQEEFLENCPVWSRPLFDGIFEEARARGLIVNWGTKGFSVRGTDASGGTLTVLYGYPAGSLGNEVPSIEVYLKYLNSTEAASLRTALRGISGFAEKGRFTIGFLLSESGLVHLQEGLPHIWSAYTLSAG